MREPSSATVAPYASVTLAAVALVLGGCDSFPSSFRCDTNAQCVLGDRTGECIGGGCAFADDACATGLRWHSTAEQGGGCVMRTPDEDAGPGDAKMGDAGPPDDAGNTDTGPEQNACGGTSSLPATPGEGCGPCDAGTWACDGPDALTCEGELTLKVPVTHEGSVSASTTFDPTFGDPFEAELSVDGDQTTSWFSSGPEPDGVPTEYLWRAPSDECIASITLVGNGNHDNSDFREDFGFGQVTIQVRDAGGTPEFSEVHNLPGTPDPDVVEMPDAMGREVALLFLGHEDDGCGGFSELTVEAWRAP